ncbi:MAG TPA: DUF3710 domain-containing protein [Arachnia sp.]|nr:DUF3710 domain-containing protein [Arachnia sp.]
MIFGRKRKAEATKQEAVVEETPTPVEEPVADDPLSEAERQASEWDAAFDRDEGPFDISEVDLDDDDVARLDFGALVATPFPGMQLQLQVNRETNTVQAIMVGDGNSAIEVAVFAAPAKSSMAGEIRADVIRQTQAQNGRIQIAQGPFGTELRRAVPVTDSEGKQAMHVSRTWLVSGPGWLLRGVMLGKATFEPDNQEAQVALFEFFSNLVVRRGTAPAVPGSALPMKVPEAEA